MADAIRQARRARAEEALRVAREAVAFRRRALELSRKFFEVGRIPRAELDRAQGDLERAEAEVERLAEELERNVLHKVDEAFRGDGAVPPDPAGDLLGEGSDESLERDADALEQLFESEREGHREPPAPQGSAWEEWLTRQAEMRAQIAARQAELDGLRRTLPAADRDPHCEKLEEQIGRLREALEALRLRVPEPPPDLAAPPASGESGLEEMKRLLTDREDPRALQAQVEMDLGLFETRLEDVRRQIDLGMSDQARHTLRQLAALELPKRVEGLLADLAKRAPDEPKIPLYRDRLHALLAQAGQMEPVVEADSTVLRPARAPDAGPGATREIAGLRWITDEVTAWRSDSEAPPLIYFAGVNCANCRTMEAAVLAEPEVKQALEGFKRAVLFTDLVPGAAGKESEQKAEANLARETTLTGQATSPLFVILTRDGKPGATLGFTADPGEFHRFLEAGRKAADAPLEPEPAPPPPPPAPGSEEAR